jgi:fibronectin-binding autotransporter adhesin
MTPILRGGISVAVLLVLALFGAAPALGATHTWIGPTNGKWSTPGNWSGGVPTSGEPGGTIVQFGASTTSTMDISGLVVDEIRFTGGNNTINGSTTLTISGSNLVQNIVSEAASNTLSSLLALTISGAAVEAASSTGTLTIAGAVGGTDGLVFAGSGGEFDLTGENTYTGTTAILSGALHIATSIGDVIVGPTITIGSGTGPGAQLVLDQENDISPETAITVNSDGTFNFQGHQDNAKSLAVNGGSVLGANLNMTGPLVEKAGTIAVAGVVSAGSLNMAGGTISGPGQLALSGEVQATSSPSGPATLAAAVQLKASPTVTVTPGVAPEFNVTGAISETGGARSITKAGAGTMVMSAHNTYTGATAVSAGTVLANGNQAGPFSVAQNGTLGGSGTVGATTVAGVLAPTAHGLHTGALSFGPTGKLTATLTSLAPATIPSAIATGAVSIDPSATLNLTVAPGTAAPPGSTLSLITDEGSGAIAGQFAGVPANSVSTFGGVPFAVNYAGGDGNDLVLTVPPQISPIGATPNPVAVGRPVAVNVTESDVNEHLLTTTWNFGDGTTGTGASTSHTYKTPGKYTVVATVSDRLAQSQSTTVVTVTGEPTASPTGATVNSSAYGAHFALTVPNSCLRKGAPAMVTLTIKKLTKGKARGNALAKVRKVVFAIAGKTVKTDRLAPFRLRLAAAPTATSGSAIRLRVKAYLKLHGGKSSTKSLTVTVKVC